MPPRNPVTLLRPALALLLVAAVPSLAAARGSHGHGRHGGVHVTAASQPGPAATDHKSANNEHLQATSEEIDKVLDAKIKNICRGC